MAGGNRLDACGLINDISFVMIHQRFSENRHQMHDRRGYNRLAWVLLPIHAPIAAHECNSGPIPISEGPKCQISLVPRVNPAVGIKDSRCSRVSVIISYLQGGPDSSKGTKNDWFYRHMLAGGCCASSV